MAITLNKPELGPCKVGILDRETGEFKELGFTDDVTLSAPSTDGRWWTPAQKLSFSCDIELEEQSRKAIEDMMKPKPFAQGDIDVMVRLMRQIGRPHHCEIRIQEFRLLSAAVHRLHGMNCTRYFKSKCRNFRGFLVHLESGYWVTKK